MPVGFVLKGNTNDGSAFLFFREPATTYCISIMLPEIPDGAKLSWLLHPALKFFIPKKRVRLGDADPKLWISEKEAWE